MIPITDELYDGFSSEAVGTARGWPEFTLLPRRLADVLRSLSEHGRVAYIEAEYFGGIGEQRCVVWRNGDTLLKPMQQEGAINKALRLLGVRTKPFIDEFDSVGLGKLPLSLPLAEILRDQQAACLQLLPVTPAHVFALPLASVDTLLAPYPVAVVW